MGTLDAETHTPEMTPDGIVSHVNKLKSLLNVLLTLSESQAELCRQLINLAGTIASDSPLSLNSDNPLSLDPTAGQPPSEE